MKKILSSLRVFLPCSLFMKRKTETIRAIRCLWGVQINAKKVIFFLKGAEMMDSKKIGAFIAAKRKKKGLTQEQLGAKLGVSNKTISRWENGNYMPDLSLLEPLSKELEISLNELLSGEDIEKEKVIEYSEQNLLSTIDYTDKKIKDEHKKISSVVIGAGIVLCIFAFTVFPSESSWGEIYSLAGLLLITAGIYRELRSPFVWKKGLISAGIFFVLLGFFFLADYIGVTQFERPPIYRYRTTTVFNDSGSKLIEYQNLFYNVYRINADTPNEYYFIDNAKQYDVDTVPTSPFNQDVSAIEHLIQYQSKYIGDNSNTGQLINALPLSEYGFVFEIDSENRGVTIYYHFTDWYDNDHLYTEKSLVYDSVSLFALIENLEYIKFNFSGNSYVIARETIKDSYPDYDEIFADDSINIKKFRQYVEQKMNDQSFVTDIFQLFDKKADQEKS